MYEHELAKAEIKRRIAEKMPDNPLLGGWHSYSQCDEDGVIRECLDRIKKSGFTQTNTFIEFGCGNGIGNNTAQLIIDCYNGCWIDGDNANIRHIEEKLGGTIFPSLWARECLLDLDNVEAMTKDCSNFLGTKEIDFFSLNIDGNDAHLLPSVLSHIRPKLLCVEYNAKFRPPTSITMSYLKSHVWKADDYFGASLQYFVDLLQKHDYALICCNISGANAFFVDEKFSNLFTRYPVAELYQPARYWLIYGAPGHRPSLQWLKQVLEERKSDVPWIVDVYAPHVGNFGMEIHRKNDPFVSGELLRSHTWEIFETEIFLNFCKTGSFVMDIGANIGWYSVVASKIVGENGKVLAIEPDEDNFALLKKNLRRSGKINNAVIEQAALSNIDSEAVLYLSSNNMGDHELYDDGTGRESVKVKAATLDSLLNGEIKLPDLVKSDTQGMEALVFDGARNLFDKGWRPVWLLEYWPYGLVRAGSDPVEFYEKLMKLDYTVFEIDTLNKSLVKLTRNYIANRVSGNLAPETMNFIDLLAVQKSDQTFPHRMLHKFSDGMNGTEKFWLKDEETFPVLRDKIIFGEGGNDGAYILGGFGHPEAGFRWTLGENAAIALNLDSETGEDIELICVVMPLLFESKRKFSRVRALINGTDRGEWKITKPDDEFKISIPASLCKNSRLVVEFKLPDAISPKDLGINNDERKLSLAFKKITLRDRV